MLFSMRRIAFCCFILSGMASVSYQMIWLRQAMTYFGVITPVNSSVLSVFMLGLALGTVLAGKVTERISRSRALKLYIIVEVLIALFAITVPVLFKAGYWLLLDLHSPQSGSYLFFSCIIITLILLPVCTLIGATLPLLMRYLEEESNEENFSFLYFANLLGALLGCLAPCILIEVLGFSGSLYFTAALNALAALLAVYALSKRPNYSSEVLEKHITDSTTPLPRKFLLILFLFGFVTLGSEVIWIKAFMPVVFPTVYSFAYILAIYLICNAIGTQAYRQHVQITEYHQKIIWLLPIAALLPIIGISMFMAASIGAFSVFSIAVLCFCLGYLTPQIIDHICQNNPKKTSLAYTINCLGCITGPLFSTYILFPEVGLKVSLILYALILFTIAIFLLQSKRMLQFSLLICFSLVVMESLYLDDKEDNIVHTGELRRDHVGYIGATLTGMEKVLTVNGIGMTGLTTITKNMAHITLANHAHPKSILVICFGMGTTVRSLAAWPVDSITAVELSKGVVQSFHYFHSDAERVKNDPRVHIIVDDGRRFLNRSHETYDAIIIDPPPPIEAAGSGLLYTVEFLDALKPHLAVGGIFQQWIPNHNHLVFANAAINAIKMRFKYVKIYRSLTGDYIDNWGTHILASDTPFSEMSTEDFVNRLPPKVVDDLKEWRPNESIEQIAQASLHVIDERYILKPDLAHIYMSDDKLYNEFYLLRQYNLYHP